MAVFIVHFSIDGFGLDALADLWVAMPVSEQAVLERAVEFAERVLLGPAFGWIITLWGLSPVLFGLAVITG